MAPLLQSAQPYQASSDPERFQLGHSELDNGSCSLEGVNVGPQEIQHPSPDTNENGSDHPDVILFRILKVRNKSNQAKHATRKGEQQQNDEKNDAHNSRAVHRNDFSRFLPTIRLARNSLANLNLMDFISLFIQLPCQRHIVV
jgi:hypothetical protein